VYNQSWSALILNGRPVVSLRLGEAWVRRNSGPQFHRQMQSLRAIACGDAAPGELAVMNQQQHQPICPAQRIVHGGDVGRLNLKFPA
jgi:hypothetical protein